MTISSTLSRFSLLLTVVSLSVLTSCKDMEDHRVPYKSQVMIEFTPQEENRKLNITHITYTNSINGWKSNNTSFYSLPLNPDADSVAFDIHHKIQGDNEQDTIKLDTLTIYYKRSPKLISPQCGATQEYVLEKVTTTFEGEAKILDKHLHNFNSTQASQKPDVQIYF